MVSNNAGRAGRSGASRGAPLGKINQELPRSRVAASRLASGHCRGSNYLFAPAAPGCGGHFFSLSARQRARAARADLHSARQLRRISHANGQEIRLCWQTELRSALVARTRRRAWPGLLPLAAPHRDHPRQPRRPNGGRAGAGWGGPVGLRPERRMTTPCTAERDGRTNGTGLAAVFPSSRPDNGGRSFVPVAGWGKPPWPEMHVKQQSVRQLPKFSIFSR